MTQPGSFIKSDILKDIRGRSKFIATPLAEHLSKVKDPEAPAVPNLFSDLDKQYLDEFGVDSKELHILMDYTRDLALTHEGVAAKLKDLLTLVKLSGAESLGARLAQHRQSIENRRQDIIRRDGHYVRKCNDVKAKRIHIEKSWINVQSQTRTRWKSILRSLGVAISRHPLWTDLHERDKYAINYLNSTCPKLVKIKDNRVSKFDQEALADIDIHVIRELVENILLAEDGS
jgi:hypothetical protein